jgi:hypothetical protein
LGWTIFIALLSKHFLPKIFIRTSLVILILSFLSITHEQAKAWRSDRSLWEHAVENEPTPMSIAFLGKLETLPGGDPKKALELSKFLLKSNRQSPEGLHIFSKSIYMLETLSSDEKDRIFKDNESLLPWYQYFWAAHMAKTNRFSEGFEHLQSTWRNDPQAYILFFSDMVTEITAQAYSMCMKAQRSDCEDFVRDVRGKVPAYRWSDREFNARLASHQIAPLTF